MVGPARLHHPGGGPEPDRRRPVPVPDDATGRRTLPLSGEYLEIDPPWRLVYTFRWEEPAPDDRETVADLSLLRAGDGTRLMLSQGPFLTEERLALHRDGWTESFEKLQSALASRS